MNAKLLLEAGKGQNLVNECFKDKGKREFNTSDFDDLLSLSALTEYTNVSVGLSGESIINILVTAYALGRRSKE